MADPFTTESYMAQAQWVMDVVNMRMEDTSLSMEEVLKSDRVLSGEILYIIRKGINLGFIKIEECPEPLRRLLA